MTDSDSDLRPLEAQSTRRLARFVADLQFEQLPTAVVDEAVRSCVNLLGCTIYGGQHPSVEMVLKAMRPFAGPAQATLPGRTERVDALLASIASGIASHVGDFDDTHPDTLVHPSGPVLSALLPLAEMRGASGRELIAALVAGVEVECRIARAVHPSHYDKGWHVTGTAGIFGAAAACARLMQLDELGSTWALGIAATQSAGLREMFGSMCKSLHVGRAAQGGLSAALLAEQGFTSAQTALEGQRGFIHVLSARANPEALTAGLDEDWELLRNTYKPFACGLVIHPVLDACIQLRERHGLHARDIAHVELQVHRLALELTGRARPSTGLEGKFSVFHGAAVGLIDGAGGELEFSDARVQAADTTALRARISAQIDASLGMEQALVSLTTVDGTRHMLRVEHCLGSQAQPLSDAALDAKFLALSQEALGNRAAAALQALRGLPTAANCTAVARALGAA